MATRKEKKVYCPECESSIIFKRTPRLGKTITCYICDTRLEVVEVNPIELDWAFEDELDYDDEVYGYPDD